MLKHVYYDIETYPNYFMIHFTIDEPDKTWGELEHIIFRCHEQTDDFTSIAKLFDNLDQYLFIGFNNNYFDAVHLDLLYRVYKAKKKFSSLISYRITEKIIVLRESPWKIRRELKIPKKTHQLDIIDNLPSMGQISLKEAGIRIGHPKLEVLPYTPGSILTAEERANLDIYCANDVEITWKLGRGLAAPEIAGKYDFLKLAYPGRWDLLCRTSGTLVAMYMTQDTDERYRPRKQKYRVPDSIRDFLQFEHPELQRIMKQYESLDIGRKTGFKESVYVYGIKLDFGLGGLHACKPGTYYNLLDHDVASYYPNMMRAFAFFPDFVSKKMRETYFSMIDERVRLKKTDPQTAGAMKLILNTTFGILIFDSSPLFSPVTGYSVTITGQLLLAKLIEMFALRGYEVTTANTDGVTIAENGDDQSWRECIATWEQATGLTFESVGLKRTTMRDVNNYAWFTGSKPKLKGAFVTNATKKAASHLRVAVDAVTNFLSTNEPVESYIERRYVERADTQDWFLYHKYGKTYHTTEIVGDAAQVFDKVIRYTLSVTNHNEIVARKDESSTKRSEYTDNVRPVFDIGDFDWFDIDVQRYIDHAKKLLSELTTQSRPELTTLFNDAIPGLPVAVSETILDTVSQHFDDGSVIPLPTGASVGYVAVQTDIESDEYYDVLDLAPTLRFEFGNQCTFVYSGSYSAFSPRQKDVIDVINTGSKSVEIGRVGSKTFCTGEIQSFETFPVARFLTIKETQLQPTA